VSWITQGVTLMKEEHIMRRFLPYCILVAVDREILLQGESSSITTSYILLVDGFFSVDRYQ
jgi:hypothetical protein